MKMKILAALLIVFFVIGCSGFQIKSSVCETAPAESLICKYIPSPETADIVLRLLNYELLKNNVWSKILVLDLLTDAEVLISDVSTYSYFAVFIFNRVELLRQNFGPEFLIISEIVNVFQDQPIPICEFDRQLILIHLKRQRQIVEMIQ